MDLFTIFLFTIFALVFGGILLGRLRHGSWTGAMLNGSIEQTYGEVLLAGSVVSSQVLKVVELKDSGGQTFAAIVVTSKAPLAASMVAYRLSKDQAREVSSLLAMAAR